MPSRRIVAKELGSLLKVLAHPDRILLINAIANGESYSVNQLADEVELSVTRVSQHLSLLRAFRIVRERREGRRKIYQLALPEISDWLIEGIDFVANRIGEVDSDIAAEAKKLWDDQKKLTVVPSQSDTA
ncbi:MAG: metalloregulator ArsR/SmtB family transcription factor [Pseudomonadota bacterium]